MAYFLDLDGTLVKLARTPLEVRLPSDLPGMLRRLHRRSGGALALISGRALKDLDHYFPDFLFPAAGQHGVERRSASGQVSRRNGRQVLPLDEVRCELRETSRRHPALFLEDKGLSLALHYRRAPQLGGHVSRVMRGIQRRLGTGYRIQWGMSVVEVVPAGTDKGRAVQEFMREAPFRGRIPVFVGDDLTDEAAFAAVNRLQGHSIKVGPGPTVARWRVENPGSVRRWLQSVTSGAASRA